MLFSVLATIISIINFLASIVIITLVLKFAIEIAIFCIESAWSTIHRPSLDKFLDKFGDKIYRNYKR
jgi:hypothetical protein